MFKNELFNNQKYTEEIQSNYKCLMTELENLKLKYQTSELNNQEKDQIITNMKNSINFITII